MPLIPAAVLLDATVNGWSANLSGPMPALPTPQPASLAVPAQPLTYGTHAESYAPVPERETDGAYIRAPMDDWYYRLHLLPPQFNLGNLAGDALRTLRLWNANFTAVTVEEFDVENGIGITYTSGATVPGDIAPLQLVRYDFTISVNGPPAVDASAVWTIDGVVYTVPITGRRVTLFPFRPNWASRVKETLQWASTVYTAFSGREQRMSLRGQPRRLYEFGLRLHKSDVSLFDVLTFGWQGRMFSVPLWNEIGYLTADVAVGSLLLPFDTSNFTAKVGGSVVAFRTAEDYEIFQIADVEPDGLVLAGETIKTWPRGSRVFPLMTSLMSANVSTTRRASTHLDAIVRFTGSPLDTVPRIDATPADQLYLGEELYLRETNWRNALSITTEARGSVADKGRGPIRAQPSATFPTVIRRFMWTLKTRDDASALRAFFGRRVGKVNPVWMPSGVDDLSLIDNVTAGDISVSVAFSEYQSLIANHPARTHVVFIMRDGTHHARRMQSITSLPDGTSLLTLNEALSVSFAPADVKRVSYLGLYRLGADEVDFEWFTDTVSEVETNLVLTEPTA